jgi:hypothetical protein
MDIDLFNTNLFRRNIDNGSLNKDKSSGGIWSFGEDSIGLYMGGRQIYATSQEVHKRGG